MAVSVTMISTPFDVDVKTLSTVDSTDVGAGVSSGSSSSSSSSVLVDVVKVVPPSAEGDDSDSVVEVAAV